ncbi:NAD(P)H-dependent oxidoreductase [Sphingomonas sp.]|uniref:NAD(P)H-dependent oxidoreductase n=1 Tax=Sphingomonas sp. TaxID=28214 RepID=UPI003B3A84E3
MTPSQPARHVVILAHPNARSFNAQVAETYCRAVEACGQVAVLRDLYAIGFDPVLREAERPGPDLFSAAPDVRAELDIVAGADALILVYPVWFGAPPAMMKGYIDRVMGYAVSPAAMQARKGNGLLQGARLVSFSSSAATGPWLAEQGQEMSIRTLVDRYLARAFAMEEAGHVHFGGIVEGTTERVIAEYLHEVEQKARHVCAIIRADQPNGDGRP